MADHCSACSGPRYLTSFGRRSFIQVGLLGGFGLSLADLLRAGEVRPATGAPLRAEGRAKSVSSQAVKEIIERAGGRVLMQEEINWAGAARTDCLTTFCKASAYPYVPYIRLENDKFMDEMVLISAAIARYY